jgi:hypothetical protein
MGFLNSKKNGTNFGIPDFHRAHCVSKISQKLFLSLLSLLSLWGAKFRQNVKNTSKNGIFNCNISLFFSWK